MARSSAVALRLLPCLLSSTAAAQLGPLFGGGTVPERPPVMLDPALPTGPTYAFVTGRPGGVTPTTCSFHRPVCVHGSANGGATLEWLRALEAAYDIVVLSLGAPPPLSDFASGGGPELDLYLSNDSEPVRIERDPDLVAPRDMASAFCTVGANSPTLSRDATFCVAEAIAFRLDAAESSHVRRALAADLWLASGAPTSEDARAIDDMQSHPERSPLRRDSTPSSAAASTFFNYLDTRHGAAIGAPGAVPLALVALSAGNPSPPGLRWRNEPDIVDVLRATFGTTPADHSRFISDFSVARAFIGSRGDGRLPDLAWTGEFGRVRFDWTIALSSLPRHVAAPRPIEPLGATYLWLDIDQNAEGVSIGFRAQWESPVAFKWTLVTVGADGREMARIDVPYLERETQAERTLVNLGGARGVLIVGTNVGDLSPTYPFDPDFEPYEPHGYTVYLAKI